MIIVNTIAWIVAGAIVALAVGIALYKWIKNTKADLSPRKEKEF